MVACWLTHRCTTNGRCGRRPPARSGGGGGGAGSPRRGPMSTPAWPGSTRATRPRASAKAMFDCRGSIHSPRARWPAPRLRSPSPRASTGTCATAPCHPGRGSVPRSEPGRRWSSDVRSRGGLLCRSTRHGWPARTGGQTKARSDAIGDGVPEGTPEQFTPARCRAGARRATPPWWSGRTAAVDPTSRTGSAVQRRVALNVPLVDAETTSHLRQVDQTLRARSTSAMPATSGRWVASIGRNAACSVAPRFE